MPKTETRNTAQGLVLLPPALLAGQPGGLMPRLGLLDEAWLFLAQDAQASAPKPQGPAKPQGPTKPPGQPGPTYPSPPGKAKGAPQRAPNHQQRRHQGR